MDKLGIAKDVVRFVASMGVGIVVKNAIKYTTPLNSDPVSKILIGVGSFVASSMIAERGAADYIDETMDKFFKPKPAVVTEEPKNE